MALTSAQGATLLATIQSAPDLNSQPLGPDGAFEIARLLNLPSNPVVTVWRTDAPTDALFDAIDFTKYTPTDSPDNTTTYLNRIMNLQVKQINLQLLLQGRDKVNANKSNVRNALRDAVIQLPSGVAGAFTTAAGVSGVNILTACTRTALRGEGILAGADATTGTVTAKLIGYEGQITSSDILNIRG